MFAGIWTPRRDSATTLLQDGEARRTDRKRLRSNLDLVTKYDPGRPRPDDDGYQSSDVEQDYAEQLPTRRRIDGGTGRAEAAEELRARRTRISKKSDAIKLTLGKNLLSDAVYFGKVEALNVNGNFRAALDHIETQEKRINDARLQEHGAADAEVFWDIVKKYMTKAYTMSYAEALAESAKRGLAQTQGEDVDSYVVRARGLRKTVKAFMKAEGRTSREVDAFKVGFSKSWIDGLAHKGNLQVAHMTAVSRGKPLKFGEIRAEAVAVEQCTVQQAPSEREHTRKAPANAAAPWGTKERRRHGYEPRGAPANAAMAWAEAEEEEEEQDSSYEPCGAPTNAASAWTGGEEEEITPAAAAVAKLAEQVGKIQATLAEVGRRQDQAQAPGGKGSPPSQQGQGGKGGYPQQGYQGGKGGKGGYPQQGYQGGKGGKGGYAHESYQGGKGGKGGYPQQGYQGGKGGKGGYQQQSYPNGQGPHPAQGGGPATPSNQAGQPAVHGLGPPPPMPCGQCTRRGQDANHEYKHCQHYVGCGICKAMGHYSKECILPCPGCGQAGLIQQRRHKSGCYKMPTWRTDA